MLNESMWNGYYMVVQCGRKFAIITKDLFIFRVCNGGSEPMLFDTSELAYDKIEELNRRDIMSTEYTPTEDEQRLMNCISILNSLDFTKYKSSESLALIRISMLNHISLIMERIRTKDVE